ncbi:MAG: hypothetical protein GX616_18970 [Planctomycetes bacterium]|nr:hypothetical protein [Planctomycetota bacterium]
MAKPRKVWQYVPAKPKPPQVPTVFKADLETKALRLIDEYLKPKHLEPPPADERFNYIADLYGRWYRHYFYFCARYNSPGPNAISPFFETKFARMEYIGGDRFNLAYMRYTGQWIEIFQDLSLDDCLAEIRDNPMFQP